MELCKLDRHRPICSITESYFRAEREREREREIRRKR